MAETKSSQAAQDKMVEGVSEAGSYQYPGLNVPQYVSDYGPRGRINRLFLIMQHLPEHAATAALEAITEASKCMKDDDLYLKVYGKAKSILGSEHDACRYDEFLLEECRKSVRDESSRLDEDVQRWRNLNKDDQARIAYVELADHFEQQGRFDNALTKYMEAYDFADSHHQMIELRIRICKAAILGNSWSHIKSYAPHILESTEFRQQIVKFKNLQGVLMICLGLYYLHKRHYSEAARQFVLNPCTHLGGMFEDIVSEEHIGLYGALCAIVAYTRGQFEDRVIRNKTFQTYLSQSKKASALVKAYHECRYADVTLALNDLEVDARIDLYLKDQSSEILSAVRGKAMVQFFSPFSAMGMDRMANAFGVSVNELESELVTCISQGHINAKIDSHKKVVQAVDPDEEGDLFREIADAGRTWTRETKAMLLRMSMIRTNVDLHQRVGQGDFDATDDDSFVGNMANFGNIFGGALSGRRNRGVF